jgi:hypothetical protein
MPARLCGATRVAGGLYWESYPLWRPVDPTRQSSTAMAEIMRQRTTMLVLDPPIRIDPEAIGLQAVGVKMIERNGVYHLMDWVGVQHYPNVADFVEEATRFGVSRRIPSNMRVDLLTNESRLLLVHERAWLEGRGDLMDDPSRRCPTHRVDHEMRDVTVEMCVRYWWDDLEGGTQVVTNGRAVARALSGEQSYYGRRRRAGPLPQRMPAIFASLKLERFAVVRDTANGTDGPLMARLDSEGVRYARVNE